MKPFSSILLISILLALGCAPSNDDATSSSVPTGQTENTADDSNPDSSSNQNPAFDVGVATVATPNGWRPNRSNGNTVVIFLREDADQTSPDEMITIDLGEPTSSTAKESAEGLAKKFGGKVTEFSDGLDGEPTYRVSIPPNYKQLLPRECLVAHHEDQVCFLFAGSKSQAEIWPTLLEIAGSWKWK